MDPSGHCVMIVDDDDDIRGVLGKIVADEGYAVVLARHGEEAVEILERGIKPAVVLLDLMMPVMNGWRVIEFFRSSATLQSVPIILISAFENSAKTLASRTDAYLGKPISLDALLCTIERFAGSSKRK
jgi:CheY-like chemotaxis protein